MFNSLISAIERCITRLEEDPKILFDKVPECPDGLNADEINRLSGRCIFEKQEVNDGETCVERWLVVHPPDASDTVRWRVWGYYLSHEGLNTKKLERTVRYLRAWQEWATPRKEAPAETDGSGGRAQGGERGGEKDMGKPKPPASDPPSRPIPNERTEQPIIDALFKMKAIGIDGLKAIPLAKRPTGERLAPKAIGRDCDGQFKATLAHMVDLGWLGNGRSHGLPGGYFLTESGAALATKRR